MGLEVIGEIISGKFFVTGSGSTDKSVEKQPLVPDHNENRKALGTAAHAMARQVKTIGKQELDKNGLPVWVHQVGSVGYLYREHPEEGQKLVTGDITGPFFSNVITVLLGKNELVSKFIQEGRQSVFNNVNFEVCDGDPDTDMLAYHASKTLSRHHKALFSNSQGNTAGE